MTNSQLTGRRGTGKGSNCVEPFLGAFSVLLFTAIVIMVRIPYIDEGLEVLPHCHGSETGSLSAES